VAQNLNLCAEALGLGSLNLGGFLDEDIMALLRLDQDREIVLYGVAVGRAAIADRRERRRPSEADGALRRF
jgi:nitroreductase